MVLQVTQDMSIPTLLPPEAFGFPAHNAREAFVQVGHQEFVVDNQPTTCTNTSNPEYISVPKPVNLAHPSLSFISHSENIRPHIFSRLLPVSAKSCHSFGV